jgi:DNA-directed RNA polymerase subunit M/transcription elongation factor TFIIS
MSSGSILNTEYLKKVLKKKNNQITTSKPNSISTKNYEAAYKLVSSLMDNKKLTFEENNLDSKNSVNLICDLTSHEKNWFSQNDLKESNSRSDIKIVEPVNVENLLQINKKIGLVCPNCKEQEVKYKLLGDRSADEGLTAYCVCRSCDYQWRIRM